MNNQLVLVLLLLLIVALVVIRTVLHVRAVRRMRAKPRPDRVKPAVPIVLSVIIVALFALEAVRVPAHAVPSILLLGVGTLLAALGGTFFAGRDLHQRAGDSWDTRRLTLDGAISLVLYLVMAAGLVVVRAPLHGSIGFGWISPVATVLLLLVGNGAAWLWRRRHPTPTTHPAPPHS